MITADELQAMVDGCPPAGKDYAECIQSLARKVIAAEKLVDALREVAGITERKKNCFPPDWRDQIAACPQCQRYKGHPIQNGICDDHRKPIYAQENHDRHETKILGYRARDIARDALAAWEAAQ